MAEKKPTNTLLIIFAIIAVGFTVFRWYGDFAEGARSGTAAETQDIINSGGFELVAEFDLDEIDKSITVTTTVPQSMMLELMSPGPENDKVINYMMEEADKILLACEDVSEAETPACVESLDFTVPPYRP